MLSKKNLKRFILFLFRNSIALVLLAFKEWLFSLNHLFSPLRFSFISLSRLLEAKSSLLAYNVVSAAYVRTFNLIVKYGKSLM